MTTVSVNASRSYDILIARGLLPSVGQRVRELLPKAGKAALITDGNVKPLYAQPVLDCLAQAGLEVCAMHIPPGEQSKTGERYLEILGWLSENRLTRTDPVIALGGGVVGDLAGFAAATYLRGVPLVQIPTTLLAMVDSSVGGKTGIDLAAGKNLAGAFYQPALVLCDASALDTLPQSVLADGHAEVIKCGMIRSADLLTRLQDYPPEETIARCVTIKRDIVQMDELDQGERMLLNFGHTVGHAVEKLSGYGVSHGHAVAIGMAVETRAALRKGLCPPQCIETLERLLSRCSLPNSTHYTADEIYRAALHDKKRAGDQITIAVPCAPGDCRLETIPASALPDWIEMGLTP